MEQNLVRIGFRQVDLVDGHDDRHVGRLGVVHRLNGLRLEALCRGDDQNDDVGQVCTAGAHVRESRVSRGVDERDRLAVVSDGRSADMLRDRPGFLRRHMGVADGVLQRGLAVVDMTHESDDRRPFLQVGRVVLRLRLGGGRRRRSRFRRGADFELVAVGGAELPRVRFADRLIDAGEFAELDEVGDEFIRLLADRFGQRLDDDRRRQRDLPARGTRGRNCGRLRPPALVRTAFAAVAAVLFPAPGRRFLAAFFGRFLVGGRGRFAVLIVEVGEIHLDQFDHIVRNDAVFGVVRFDSLTGEFFDH